MNRCMEAGNNGDRMFTSISIATSIAIGLHFMRKLRQKFAEAPKNNPYPGCIWGGPETPMRMPNDFYGAWLRGILNEEFPDHYPIFEGDGYASKELQIISAPTKFDRKAMHGIDIEKLMLEQLEREISRDIDKADRLFYANMSKN